MWHLDGVGTCQNHTQFCTSAKGTVLHLVFETKESTRRTNLTTRLLVNFGAYVDQDIGRALQRNCLSDILLGEIGSNPARFCRTRLSLYLTSTTGHANGSIPDVSLCVPVNSGKLLRVAEKGEPFRANMQAVNVWDREQPRTDWQRQRGTRSRRVLRLIRAQGCVVRREARTQSCCHWCRK